LKAQGPLHRSFGYEQKPQQFHIPAQPAQTIPTAGDSKAITSTNFRQQGLPTGRAWVSG